MGVIHNIIYGCFIAGINHKTIGRISKGIPEKILQEI